jgi:predicted house-cleaning noncanonical NTP pyrophosphatase (MazG superfamily)
MEGNTMPVYNKLVRDKIPGIIEANGETAITKILEDEEYIKYLKKKSYEEMDEYCAAESNAHALEELADMLEIIHALASQHGSSINEVEKARQEKAEKRGGFLQKTFLIEVID